MVTPLGWNIGTNFDGQQFGIYPRFMSDFFFNKNFKKLSIVLHGVKIYADPIVLLAIKIYTLVSIW